MPRGWISQFSLRFAGETAPSFSPC
jgi:hypothetical protein